MLTLRTTELLITLITFFIAYVFAVTIAGAFRAWVSQKMGDDTAASLGFTSLNPLDHIDFVGVIFLFLFFFGWGRHVPINHFNFEDPYRRIKLSVAYLSDTCAYFVSAIIGLTFLIISVGPRMLVIAQQMLICRQNMSHYFLLQSCPTLSSLTITLSFIAIAFVYLNVILAVLSFILNLFSLGLFYVVDRSHEPQNINQYLIILLPIVFIIFFSEPLRIFAIYMISLAGYGLSKAIGLV